MWAKIIGKKGGGKLAKEFDRNFRQAETLKPRSSTINENCIRNWRSRGMRYPICVLINIRY